MLISEKLHALNLSELNNSQMREIEGGTSGEVYDDPTNPNDDGCIPYPDPIEDIIQ